ncbi:uroporphyrinogen-III C-methyltransferase [Candidimonas humi]|uniref:Uroporphyrinogen-III C-methyltransferase n=1 Tax=Candidimonas humi TaxID=683355 RepID=A0ABV8NVH3_9BURK|nr:uroporphyrinogen-III C-methyltransferase [Candidimonas humi]MBV6303259.1 uroporphyrinogen-III C-methyltransferase [Candidimonas humi]
MTENRTEINPSGTPAPSDNKPTPDKKPAAARPAGSVRSAARTGLRVALAIVIIVAIGLGAGLWYQQRVFKRVGAQLESRVADASSIASQAREQAQQAVSLAQTQTRQLEALQASLDQTQARYQSLEQAFQTLTDSGSELTLINDVDHLVNIAHQQLALGGNVANAIVALETAQAQLARANRPNLASLQQTINGDLDRLRTVATTDVPMLSHQLDTLESLIATAPLLVPDAAAPGLPAADAQPQGGSSAGAADTTSGEPAADVWWRRAADSVYTWSSRAWASLRHDLGQFISVRRAADPAALLMSPDQATQLRQNLRLRAMTAQLALLMRQPGVWKTETRALEQALATRYDGQADQTRQALKIARGLADTAIDVKLPTVDNSLQALQTLRDAQAKQAAKQSQRAAAPDGAAAQPQPGHPQE